MRGGRPKPPDTVYFPVVPMLDMAFQLLAFFILTFQAPSDESRIDLDLPATPAALPGGASRPSSTTADSQEDRAPETDVTVRAVADESGTLRSLRVGVEVLDGLDTLADHLHRLVASRAGRPLRVALVADDNLLYDQAAKLLGACETAGVIAIRLVPPGTGRDATAEGGSP